MNEVNLIFIFKVIKIKFLFFYSKKILFFGDWSKLSLKQYFFSNHKYFLTIFDKKYHFKKKKKNTKIIYVLFICMVPTKQLQMHKNLRPNN